MKGGDATFEEEEIIGEKVKGEARNLKRRIRRRSMSFQSVACLFFHHHYGFHQTLAKHFLTR
jgi:hypothetical protein